MPDRVTCFLAGSATTMTGLVIATGGVGAFWCALTWICVVAFWALRA